METPIIKSTAYYAKVKIALSQSIARELLFAALIALAAFIRCSPPHLVEQLDVLAITKNANLM
jgi:hypothetical protein